MEFVINGRFLAQRITGVQRYARELTQALDAFLDSNAELKITVLTPKLTARLPSWRNIKVRQVGHLKGHAWEQLELPWYSRGKALICLGNTAPIISLLSGQPVVVTVHDLSYKYFPNAYKLAYRLSYSVITPLIFKFARCVITVSESERRSIVACYPKADRRLHAIANGGLPAGLSIGTPHEQPQERHVLYVGSFSKRKNFPRMLEVARRLSHERHFRFVFVGGGSKSLTNARTDSDLTTPDEIKLVDAIEDAAALVPYYNAATCFLFPSLYESSGLPPIEAMACGCPVIASEIPALRERCGEAALYCDPYDVDSIATAIEKMMDDEALRLRLRILGRQRAASYSWESCARKTLNLIEATLQPNYKSGNDLHS
jgi:glycosyltransferase involved in cell wall biosynthesis